MTPHVADSSAFGPLLFADERDDAVAGFEQLIVEGACIVPSHWPLEVTNQLVVGLRRRRTTRELADELLTMLHALPLTIDQETDARVAETYALALEHALTIYDAAYLELAVRTDATLVTFDKRLRAAASARDLALLP